MAGRKKDPLYRSFGYAFEGIFTCIRNERNMKIHVAVTLLVIIAGFVLGLSITEWCICLGLFGLVMALELVNTAVEAVVDLVTAERHPACEVGQGHSCRSGSDRCDHGCGHRASDICTEGTYVSETTIRQICFAGSRS